MVAILIGAYSLGGPAAVLVTLPALELLGAVAGTTGSIAAVAEGAIVGAGVVAGGTVAAAEAAGIAAATIAGPVADMSAAISIGSIVSEMADFLRNHFQVHVSISA